MMLLIWMRIDLGMDELDFNVAINKEKVQRTLER